MGLQKQNSNSLNKGYNEKSLKKAGHNKPDKPVDGSTQNTWPEYGKKIQYGEDDNSPYLSEKKH